MTGEQYVGDARSDGTIMGRSATDTIGFYGADPVAQRAWSGFASVTTAAAISTGHFGFTSADANLLKSLVNEMRATFVALGLAST